MTCLAPGCGGVIELGGEAAGECRTCKVRHRRPNGNAKWDQIVGPVIVTVDDATFASTAAPNTRDFMATDVRFDAKWVILDGDMTFPCSDVICITTAP
jgi:hypothetical protein